MTPSVRIITPHREGCEGEWGYKGYAFTGNEFYFEFACVENERCPAEAAVPEAAVVGLLDDTRYEEVQGDCAEEDDDSRSGLRARLRSRDAEIERLRALATELARCFDDYMSEPQRHNYYAPLFERPDIALLLAVREDGTSGHSEREEASDGLSVDG